MLQTLQAGGCGSIGWLETDLPGALHKVSSCEIMQGIPGLRSRVFRVIGCAFRFGLHGIAAALPIMREQGSGHIINVASVSAHRVDPTAAVYCATKMLEGSFSLNTIKWRRETRITARRDARSGVQLHRPESK